MSGVVAFLALATSFLSGIHTEARFVNPDQCLTYPVWYGSDPYAEQGWVDPADGEPHYCVDDGPSFWVYRITWSDGSFLAQQIGVVEK